MLLLWRPVAKYSGRDVSVICPNKCRCRFRTGRTVNLLRSLFVSQRGFLKCHSGNVVRLVSDGGSLMFVQTRAGFLPVLVLNRGWFEVYSFRYSGWLKLDESHREFFFAGASFPLCLVLLLKVCEFGQSWHFNVVSSVDVLMGVY